MPKIAQNSKFDIAEILKAAREQLSGDGLPPVESWEPDYCGEMDLSIKRDGTWWHEGRPILREAMIRLFSTILRKDEDGRHYLVTPVEKIAIHVELAAFLAVRVDCEGTGPDQTLIFTTNMGETVALGEKRSLRLIPDLNEAVINAEDNAQSVGKFVPLLTVRGRLEALLTRPVFYELANYAQEKDGVIGVCSQGDFFSLDV